jgi:sugar (pentulose or hexulose) kinase
MDAWSREIIGVRELLRDIRQILRKGERVFLTGGGFKIEAIRHFITQYLDSDLVVCLENPENVNITGIC